PGNGVILDGRADLYLVTLRIEDIIDMYVGVWIAIVLADEAEATITFPGGDLPQGSPVSPRRVEDPGGADERLGLLGEPLSEVVLAGIKLVLGYHAVMRVFVEQVIDEHSDRLAPSVSRIALEGGLDGGVGLEVEHRRHFRHRFEIDPVALCPGQVLPSRRRYLELGGVLGAFWR